MKPLWWWLLGVQLLLIAPQLSAQEDELWKGLADSFEPYSAMIESDTSLFYRAIQLPQDLYGEQMEYAFHRIAAARRGIEFPERHWLWSDLPVSYRSYSLLRSLGFPHEPTGGIANRSLAPFQPSEPSSHNVQLHLNSLRYRFGARYRGEIALPNTWQLRMTAVARSGRDAMIHGVFHHSIRLAFAAQREWGEGKQLSLVAGIAPTKESRAGSSTQEAFDLIGSSYYNPSWGFFEGKERSAAIHREALPFVGASFSLGLNTATTLRLQGSFEGGIRRRGSLAWFDAHTPRPDNYRLLPSHFTDETTAEAIAERWRAHDSRYTQIDWEELNTENRLSSDGAHYIEQERVEERLMGNLLIEAETRLSRSWRFRYGVWGQITHQRYYMEVKDLLGASYHRDMDYFLVDDATYGNLLENDLRHPGRQVVEGDRFGYDYAIERQQIGMKAEAAYQKERYHLRMAFRIEECRTQRRGYFEKELFAGSGSYGPSSAIDLAPYALEITAGFAFTPRHYIGFEAFVEGQAPKAEALFLQSEYNNRTIDQPTLELYRGAELLWRNSGQQVTWSATLFLRSRHQGCEVTHYYDDLSRLYTDCVTRNISERYWGIEGAVTWYANRHWRLEAALTALQASYVENARVSLYADRDNQLLCAPSESYLRGIHPGGVPQLQARLGINYYGNHWGIRLIGSYAGARYAHPNFVRRTSRIAFTAESEEALIALQTQERLHDFLRADLSLWKSFFIKAHRLTLSLSIENLFNDQKTPYDSYESARMQRWTSGGKSIYRPLQNQLRYAAPRSAYLSLSLLF